MRKPISWYLVADARQARIVREVHSSANAGERLEDLVFEAEQKDNRLGKADRPGRSFSSHDTRRSAMEYPTDPALKLQRMFAEKLVKTVAEYHAAGSFDQLVVVAAPRMLGLLRDALPNTLRSVVIAEIAKDLTTLSESALHLAVRNLDITGAQRAD